MGIETERVELNSMLLQLLTILLFCSCVQGSAGLQTSSRESCPDGWIDATDPGLGCLYFSNSRATWEGAANSCQDSGALLLELWTELEVDFVRSWLKAFSASGVNDDWWVGGTDQGREGHWYWAGSLAPVADFVWTHTWSWHFPKLFDDGECWRFLWKWLYLFHWKLFHMSEKVKLENKIMLIVAVHFLCLFTHFFSVFNSYIFRPFCNIFQAFFTIHNGQKKQNKLNQ